MIGKYCRVKLIPKYFNTDVRGASRKLVDKYPKYAKLHNKEVIVAAKSEKKITAYKVYLKDEGPDYWFTLDQKYLKVLAGPISCNCTTKTLMCRGCQCGAFIREKMKTDHDDQEHYDNTPW